MNRRSQYFPGSYDKLDESTTILVRSTKFVQIYGHVEREAFLQIEVRKCRPLVR
jgi:hypothetical protein